MKDIIPEAVSADSGNGKGQRHGKSLKELLGLWRERQAASTEGELPGAACLFNGERSSLEDSQHLGVGELDLSPKNNPLLITLSSDPSQHATQPTLTPTPAPRRGDRG